MASGIIGTTIEDVSIRRAIDELNMPSDSIDEKMITKAKEWFRAAKSKKFTTKTGNENALEYLCLHAICIQ